MLTSDQFDALIEPILELYARYTQSVLSDIARRLVKMDMINTAAWSVQRLSESGMLYEEILERISKLTGKSETELRRLFEKAGVKSIAYDDAIYIRAGLKPLPLNLSPAMAQTLAAGLRKTQGVIRNLTMTTALSAQNSFLDAADLAYMQVSTGAFDYITAIRAAVKDVASKGLTVINYASGRQDQLDVAMRRAVLTGVSQTAGQLQLQRVQEMGTDLVAVPAHLGARNKGEGPMNHESWQGAVYSVSGGSNKYKSFIETTGYGTGEGLGGWNCGHSFYPWIEGLSTPPEDGSSFVGETVTYNGKKMSLYEAAQQQRAIERKIRYWKRQAGALESAGLDNQFELSQVEDYQKEMRGFLKQMNDQLPEPKEGELPLRWYRQPERERIGYTPDLVKTTDKIDFRSGEYQRVADLGDLRSRYQPDDPGSEYTVPRPVIYNEFAVRHLASDAVHRARLPWLEKNTKELAKAISSPDFIEKQLRLRKDGYFSATHIAELIEETGENRYIVVAISLSKNPTGGYHQITTIHPARWKDIFKSDGTLRDKYIRAK